MPDTPYRPPALLLGSLMFERALQTAVSERLMSANLSVHEKQG